MPQNLICSHRTGCYLRAFETTTNNLKMVQASTPALKLLRIFGFGEAFSWLLLLFIAMPLKYFAGQPLMVTYVGWLHGLLFMLYILQLVIVKFRHNWSWIFVVKGFIASIFPFGTLVFDKTLREKV